MLTYDQFRERRYFAGLDGLRAISITLVILHHMPRFPSEWWRNVQEHGSHGVSLFFVISGFLISSLLLREQDEFGRVSLKRFFARRALRLFPLYYAVFAAVYLAASYTHLFAADSAQQIRDNVFAYLFYFSNWLPLSREGPFFFSWSLAAEEQFYTVFGVLMLLASRGAILKLVGVLLVAKALIMLSVRPDLNQSTMWRVVLSYQEPILWGVLLGFALNNRRIYEALGRVLRPTGAVLGLAALCLGWMILRPIGPHDLADERLLFPVLAVFVAAAATRSRVPVLDGVVFSHVGKVSYGMYLIHWYVLVALVRVLPQGTSLLLFSALTMGIIVGVASVLYAGFERPIIAFGRAHFGASRTARPATRFAPEPALPNPLAVGLVPPSNFRVAIAGRKPEVVPTMPVVPPKG